MNPLRLPISSFRRKVCVDFQMTPFKSSSVPVSWEHLSHEWFKDFFSETQLLNALPEDFHFQMTIEPQQSMYLVEITGRMNPHLECARSLTPFQTIINFKETCYFIQNSESDASPVVGDKLLDCYEFEGEFLDVKEFLLDSLYNSLPDRPLCQPNCKGLCNECGSNLNETFKCPLSVPCSQLLLSVH